MALAGLEAHHRSNSGRFHSTVEARVPPAKCPGPQEDKTTRMEQVARAVSLFGARVPKTVERHAAFSNVRRVTEPTPSQNGNGTAGFALLAGDEGEPFAQEVPLGESEEVHNSKREPTHRGEDCQTGTA